MAKDTNYRVVSRFNERSKIKNIGNVLIGYNDKYRGNLGFDINELKIINLEPYDFALGGKIYLSNSEFSQSDPQTMKKEWFSKEKFDNGHRYLDALATDDWVIVLSIKDTYNEDVKNKLQLCVYDRNSGEIIKEIIIGFGWTLDDIYSARLSLYNKKIIIQTQIGVFILGDKKNTKVRVSENILLDDQPEPIDRRGVGKGNTPNYPDPIPKILNISNVSDQILNFRIIVPNDSKIISIIGQSEFELKPGESKEILHQINQFNSVCPILIQIWGATAESLIIVTAIRNYPD